MDWIDLYSAQRQQRGLVWKRAQVVFTFYLDQLEAVPTDIAVSGENKRPESFAEVVVELEGLFGDGGDVVDAEQKLCNPAAA